MGAVFADRESVSDAQSAQQWLSRYRALDAEHFIEHVGALLQDLASRPRADLVQLAVLETVRTAFFDAFDAQLRDCEFRAVPMTGHESQAFLRAVEVARWMRDLYGRLAESADKNVHDPVHLREEERAAQRDRSGKGPSVSHELLAIYQIQQRSVSMRGIAMQRVLATQSHVIMGSYRARVSVAQEDWDRLVRFSRVARAEDLTDEPVTDPTLPDVKPVARANLVACVLVMLAKPQTMNVLEFNTTRDLARRLAHRIKYRIEEGAEAAAPGPWPSFAATPFATVMLDTRGTCMDEIKRLHAELSAGYSPEQVGLDKRISNASALNVVARLLGVWRTPAQPTPAWRRPLGERALAVPTFHAVLAGLAKGGFDPTVTNTQSVYQYRQRHEEPIVSRGDPVAIKMEALFKDAEPWQITGENAQGFMFTRRALAPRVNLDQLVVMSTGNGFQRAAVFLGRIDWLRQEPQTEFDQRPMQEIGVRLMLGTPSLVAIKLDGAVFEDAFMLRSGKHGATMSMLELRDVNVEASSLVLPLARWKDGMVTEMVVDGSIQRVRLGKLLFRGQDYDQIAFALI